MFLKRTPKTPEEIAYKRELKEAQKAVLKAQLDVNWGNKEIDAAKAEVKRLSKPLTGVSSYSAWVEDDFVLYHNKIKTKKETRFLTEDLTATVSPAGRVLVLMISTKDWSTAGDMDVTQAAKIHEFASAVNRQVERLKEDEDLIPAELIQAQAKEASIRAEMEERLSVAKLKLEAIENNSVS